MPTVTTPPKWSEVKADPRFESDPDKWTRKWVEQMHAAGRAGLIADYTPEAFNTKIRENGLVGGSERPAAIDVVRALIPRVRVEPFGTKALPPAGEERGADITGFDAFAAPSPPATPYVSPAESGYLPSFGGMEAFDLPGSQLERPAPTVGQPNPLDPTGELGLISESEPPSFMERLPGFGDAIQGRRQTEAAGQVVVQDKAQKAVAARQANRILEQAGDSLAPEQVMRLQQIVSAGDNKFLAGTFRTEAGARAALRGISLAGRVIGGATSEDKQVEDAITRMEATSVEIPIIKDIVGTNIYDVIAFSSSIASFGVAGKASLLKGLPGGKVAKAATRRLAERLGPGVATRGGGILIGGTAGAIGLGIDMPIINTFFRAAEAEETDIDAVAKDFVTGMFMGAVLGSFEGAKRTGTRLSKFEQSARAVEKQFGVDRIAKVIAKAIKGQELTPADLVVYEAIKPYSRHFASWTRGKTAGGDAAPVTPAVEPAPGPPSQPGQLPVARPADAVAPVQPQVRFIPGPLGFRPPQETTDAPQEQRQAEVQGKEAPDPLSQA